MAKTGSHRHSDPPARHFGPYELVRRLGVGGMAETFEAIRTGPGGFTQRVCLKLVQPFFRDKPDFLALFEREARLAAKLRHSNIVGVIDFGRIEGATYMALELVDGIDLAMLLDAQPGRRLSHEQVALIGHEIARALEHAHDPRRGATGGGTDTTIIHRDVSPSNVMISRRGEVLLTDFGVAKAITGTARKQSAVKGKVPYMSPEQLRAEHLDGRSDLFSLGVVLFEALTGARPFQGEHDPAIIMKILQGDRPSLRSMAPGAPAGLCDVIERLLETDPAKRPAGATELLELIDPFVPAPRERRALGRMATEAQELQATRSDSVPPPGTDETSGVSQASGSLAPEPPGARSSAKTETRHRSSLAWILLAATLIGLAWFLWHPGAVEPTQRAPASHTPPAGQPSSPPVVPYPVDEKREDSTQDQAETAKTTDTATPPDKTGDAELAPPRPAQLNVFVFPWGRVWINGKPYGSAPLQNISLKAGRYKISAGQDTPSKTKTVRLRYGDRKTVQFDLTD